MAKKSGLKNTLQLNKKTVVKKTKMDVAETEKAVKKLHSSQGKVKRITIDIPLELHAAIKIKAFKEGITLKKYMLDLAKDDLNFDEKT